MVGPAIPRSARAILTLLLVGLAHAVLLGSVGRTSGARTARAVPDTAAAVPVPVAPAPIQVRMLLRPAMVTVTAAATASPARPHGKMLHHSNTEPIPAPAALETIESPAAAPSSAAATTDTRYRPSAELDRAALPRSAPDTRLLDDVVLSGLPLRLRICIDAFGQVTQVLTLQAHPDDAAAVTALQEMFRSTAYVPGRLGGADVASYIDLDISVGPGPGS